MLCISCSVQAMKQVKVQNNPHRLGFRGCGGVVVGQEYAKEPLKDLKEEV